MNEGIAASVFLGAYTLYSIVAIAVVLKKGFWTTYTHLLFYGIIRVGAQICGVAFSKLGLENYGWLVGYLVLGVEGYFILVLSSFYLLINVYQEKTGQKDNKFNRSIFNKSDGTSIKLLGSEVTFKGIMFQYMIVANVLLAVGGSILCSLKADEYETKKGTLNASKALRGAGQIIFLIVTIIVVALTVCARFWEKIRHSTITFILVAAPFLLIRAIYGTLSCFVNKMNYFQLSNYTEDGLSTYFVATEYCLATTMEFVSASLLISTFLISRYESRRGDFSTSSLDDKEGLEVVTPFSKSKNSSEKC